MPPIVKLETAEIRSRCRVCRRTSAYGGVVDYSWAFVAVALALVLTPGADLMLVIRNSVLGGRRLGTATTLGVSTAAAFQGLLVSLGIASLIVRAQPVFLAIKWAGVAFLLWIAISSLRSAIRGEYAAADDAAALSSLASFRQGFLCNVSNPKILVFYLSLLPQFVARDAPLPVWLLHAWTIPALGTVWCLAAVAFVASMRTWLQRRNVRRLLDAASGVVMLGFCARLARGS